MSIFSEAQVSFVLADYASVDSAGKINVIGGGITFVGVAAPGQPSAPFTVVTSVSVPAKYVNDTYALSIELHDVTVGQFVMLPGEGGQLQPVRAQQPVTVRPLQVAAGMAAPPDAMQTHTVVMQFANGLPLTPGHSFEWRVQVDGQHRQNWWHRFHVLAPEPGPVFGGPAGSPSIPGVGTYVVEDHSPPSPAEGSDEPGDSAPPAAQ